MVKKADIRKVQDVRMFFFVVLSTSLVQDGDNFSYIVKMNDVLKRIEGVLIDPSNCLTLKDMESERKSDEEENFRDFCFKRKHANAVKDIYKKITPVKSFCTFLQELNDGTYSLEPKDDMAGKSAPNDDDKKPKDDRTASKDKDKDPKDKKSVKDKVQNFFTWPKSDKADKSEQSKGDEETGALASSVELGKRKCRWKGQESFHDRDDNSEPEGEKADNGQPQDDMADKSEPTKVEESSYSKSDAQ